MNTLDQRQTPAINTPESDLDHNIRLLPTPANDAGRQDSILMAFDARAHQPLQDMTFAYSLDRTLGVHAENRVHVPLTWVADNELLTPEEPDFFERVKELRGQAGELDGYFGIRLSKEGMDTASDKVAAGIAALISDIYHGDEQLRVLYNHTQEQPAEPIEITGPDYNLAEEATQEHPLVDLEEIVQHPISIRHLKAAPDLARISFA